MTLLVIDVQKGITDERLYNYKAVISNILRVIGAAREGGAEVIFIQHDDGPDSGFSVGDEAFELADEIRPRKGERVYIKTVNSCFSNRELTEHLKNKHENTLMIVGLQTDYCVDATVKSAFERGFKVIVPGNANSTFDNIFMNAETVYRYFNELIWPKRYAECVSLEEALGMLSVSCSEA